MSYFCLNPLSDLPALAKLANDHASLSDIQAAGDIARALYPVAFAHVLQLPDQWALFRMFGAVFRAGRIHGKREERARKGTAHRPTGHAETAVSNA